MKKIVIYEIIDLLEGLDFMYNAFCEYIEHKKDEYIITLECNNVYTIGKGVIEYQSKIENIPVYKVNRGGDWTFHGVGQVIIYFVYDIQKRLINISDFVDKIEDILISFFAEYYSITLYRNKEFGRGLWIMTIQGKLKKICFIGLEVKKGVILHGISISIANDIYYFDNINPCGISQKDICTSFLKEGYNINIFDIKEQIAEYLECKLL